MDSNARLYGDLTKILVTREEIAEAVKKLGTRITQDYQGRDLMIIGILKGAVVFYSDLIREIDLPLRTDFMAVSSYGSATKSSGAVQITHDIQQDITGRHLVVIEDILDSGNTLAFLKQYFLTKGAASVTICTLLDKPSRRTKAVHADYVGFEVPDEFVVGYGLDYAQKYRNLPYIGVLKPEVYGG